MTNVSRRSRNWVFTLNNPQPVETPAAWAGYRFVHWQEELSASGTPHLQGVVVWNSAKTLAACRIRSERAHWEVMRGTLDQAIKYCSKEETRVDGPWSMGTKPMPGKRNDLWEVKQQIDKGKSDVWVANAYWPQYCKFYKAFANYRLMTTPQRNARPTIFILWGASGTGKTRMVRTCFPDAYWKPKSKWWDGYTGQEVVVFDEFYSWIKLDELLRILDWYPLQLEIKGGSVQMTSSCFVFTSNVDPMDWYMGMGAMRRSPLHCRFEEFGTIVEFE